MTLRDLNAWIVSWWVIYESYVMLGFINSVKGLLTQECLSSPMEPPSLGHCDGRAKPTSPVPWSTLINMTSYVLFTKGNHGFNWSHATIATSIALCFEFILVKDFNYEKSTHSSNTPIVLWRQRPLILSLCKMSSTAKQTFKPNICLKLHFCVHVLSCSSMW